MLDIYAPYDNAYRSFQFWTHVQFSKAFNNRIFYMKLLYLFHGSSVCVCVAWHDVCGSHVNFHYVTNKQKNIWKNYIENKQKTNPIY